MRSVVGVEPVRGVRAVMAVVVGADDSRVQSHIGRGSEKCDGSQGKRVEASQ